MTTNLTAEIDSFEDISNWKRRLHVVGLVMAMITRRDLKFTEDEYCHQEIIFIKKKKKSKIIFVKLRNERQKSKSLQVHLSLFIV